MPVKSLLIRPIAEPSEPDTAEPAPWAVPAANVTRSRWAPITLVVAGCLPLVFWHFIGLLQRPHYQFVALLPIAAALLLYRHRGRGGGEIRPLAPLPLATLALGAVGLAAATY